MHRSSLISNDILIEVKKSPPCLNEPSGYSLSAPGDRGLPRMIERIRDHISIKNPR